MSETKTFEEIMADINSDAGNSLKTCNDYLAEMTLEEAVNFVTNISEVTENWWVKLVFEIALHLKTESEGAKNV